MTQNLTPTKLSAIRDKEEALRRKKAAAEREEVAKAEERQRVYYRKRTPEIIAKFENALKEASREGENNLSFEYADHHLPEHPFLAALQKYCDKNKLKYTTSFAKGTMNMGDSAAPCNVDWVSYRIEVDW